LYYCIGELLFICHLCLVKARAQALKLHIMVTLFVYKKNGEWK
jgi:hypothetical protein